MIKKICLYFLLFACFGCSYKFKDAPLGSVNVPFITDDAEGYLTKSLIYQLSSDGIFNYESDHADYTLKVDILDTKNEKIGYRRDRDQQGNPLKNLMPTESRQVIKAEVFLESNIDHKTVWGPVTITTDTDYDYVEQDSFKDLSFVNSYHERQDVLSFSLGQMESVGSAQVSALKPLYRKLARNIVDALKVDFN